MKNLKLILLGILTIVYGRSLLAQSLSTDSTYTYNKNNQKEWHYLQKDVYCFKLNNEAKYKSEYNNNIVDTILYWSGVTSKFNEIHFNKNSSINERESFIDKIKQLSNFKIGAFALTKTPNLNYGSSKYFQTDDRILITFKNKRINQSTIINFAKKYHLELIYSPPSTLPKDLYWSYTFRLKPNNKQLTNN